MSVDLSGEITAIATAVLAVFAILTAAFAFLAYRAQAQQVGILQEQMKEQQEATARQATARALQAQEQHRAQASKVFIVYFPMAGQDKNHRVVNSSEQPIYEAKVQVQRSPQDRLESQTLGTMLPHSAVDTTPPTGGPILLTFRDAAGVHWRLGLDGHLDEEPVTG